MKYNLLFSSIFILSLCCLLCSCGKKKHDLPQSQSNTKIDHADSVYPGVINIQKDNFNWAFCSTYGTTTVNSSINEYEVFSNTHKRGLKISGPFIIDNTNLGINITAQILVGPIGSFFVGDNMEMIVKDIGRFEGTLKCKRKCILRTATPISKFKMKLDGKFTVYLTDETP